ncbi:hypothetical protein GUJ93_ZPchr0002g23674 [Zizania palustris]|uniref:Uncharacterized protein n=1 Tax=Zizania palustris TaxID=103762 RepID=A0A8J5SSV8_ZIZPA|nr:hypothetical protein GUJ93_ZPchr0002g23674 [Zizania palustris]
MAGFLAPAVDDGGSCWFGAVLALGATRCTLARRSFARGAAWLRWNDYRRQKMLCRPTCGAESFARPLLNRSSAPPSCSAQRVDTQGICSMNCVQETP